MKRALIFLAAAAMAGCATTSPPEPVIRVIEKAVPTPVPCVPASTPAPPVTPDTADALAKASPADRIRLWRAANEMLHQWAAEVAPVLDACRKP